MNRVKFSISILTVAVCALALGGGPRLAASPQHHAPVPGGTFVVDVAMDGRTWRMNDGTNPFFEFFTGALARGNTFIVSGVIYRARTLSEGGTFRLPGDPPPDNPPGPETPDPIGTWVCRGTFNLDIGDIGAGAYPHVTSTQIFTFHNGDVLVTEGPEGGAPVLRSVIGGAGRYRRARGDVIEIPLGINTTNLFNVRFRFRLQP
jgi:hypothetical protein